MNTDGQPNLGIIYALMNPPPAAPIEKPQYISITSVSRLLPGQYFEERAMAIGVTPPRPSPAMKRNVSSS
jgi:hypothetical protein